MESKHKRNPPWSREELILALDLYLSRGLLDDRHPEVISLSESLRKLSAVEQRNPDVFRNNNGVAMKLGNFAALDPNYSGKGLSAGGKSDRIIWDELSGNTVALAAAVREVKQSVQVTSQNSVLHLVQDENSEFDPYSIEDRRARLVATIVRRRGQPAFRRALISAYDGRCAISGCDAVEALEAAHILAYMGNESDHVCNGLLLRSDLHVLFDLGLLAIDPQTLKVALAARIKDTSYSQFEQRSLTLPVKDEHHPSKAALAMHYSASHV